jgi:hypothetical protein
MTKIILSYKLSTDVPVYPPFMVTSTADGKPRPIYGGLYMVEGYDEGYFFLTWVAAYGFDLPLHFRRSTFAHFDMYFVFFNFCLWTETSERLCVS